MGLIYITTNKINNKKYIGKQFNENKKGYLGSGVALKAAIKKYGKENFTKEILISGINDKNDLSQLEKEYIKNYKAQESNEYYNIAPGGDGGCVIRNHKWSEESKNKYKERCKIRNSNPEYLKKLSESRKGYKATEEAKRNQSIAHKNQTNLNLAKAILQFDLNNNFIKEYISMSQACKELGKTPKNSGQLSKAAKNPNKYSAYGFKWRYKILINSEI